MEKRETLLQLWPQVHLHVVTVARVDIKGGQMKEVNEKALKFYPFFLYSIWFFRNKCLFLQAIIK